ncbi:MFS transporter [Streptomyces sp. NA04227]|uniref:MFS transporter n=1 Tax=Streptomyces sp. NA04227 TaxID=2742136 RepID=UPI00158FAF56|nr:MFS transporter [Streptomyces sp. NA04227]QKW06638.1 MFS transporter [Streptomyces sp. NA04227]
MSSASKTPALNSLVHKAPSYSAVLRQPDVPRIFLAALTGRFSYGIVFVALTVALSRATGSYAWAGLSMAAFGLTASALGPLRARWIDRRGPRRVLPVLAVAYAAVLVALTAATWSPGVPPSALLALALLAGACAPPLGPVMRALWSALLPDPQLRQRAFSLDTVVEELLYVAGPLVAGLCITFGNPAFGVGISAVLVLVGSLAMAASPVLSKAAAPGSARDPDADGGEEQAAEDAAARASLRRKGWLVPAAVAGGLGASTGAMGLLVVAFAHSRHHVEAVAWIQAAIAVGSATGGMLYGARTWRLSSAQRLPLLAIALAVVLGTAGLAPNLIVLAVAAGCTGIFIAPVLSTAYLYADECATPETRTQVGTWVNSAFNAGYAVGTAGAGLLLGGCPLWLCFVAAALPTLATAVLALTGPRREGGPSPEPSTTAAKSGVVAAGGGS